MKQGQIKRTQNDKPDFNLQRYKDMTHTSRGRPRLISVASSAAFRGLSPLLIWHFPSPESTLSPLNIASPRSNTMGGKNTRMHFEFWQKDAIPGRIYQKIPVEMKKWRQKKTLSLNESLEEHLTLAILGDGFIISYYYTIILSYMYRKWEAKASSRLF